MIGKVIPLALLAATLVASGCNVQQKGSNGNEDVKIETPMGGMKVKTNDAAADPGLPVYPGATMVKKDKDSGAADVNMNFGNFHLRVRAVGYHTPDPPEKVMAFYRNGLAHYGDVIECKNHHPVGSPSKTSQGLTCGQNDHYGIGNVSSHGGTELKAGDKAHQHIVAIDSQPDGTKFDLLALDLPGEEKESN
jgi:hypothetical protein